MYLYVILATFESENKLIIISVYKRKGKNMSLISIQTSLQMLQTCIVSKYKIKRNLNTDLPEQVQSLQQHSPQSLI